MTHFDEQVLTLVMARTQAWERLHDTEYAGRLSTNDFYELLLAAGYGEAEAQRAANRRGWDRLQAGVAM
jgi:hypothetical protein